MEEDGKDYGLAQTIEIGLRKKAFYRTEKYPWSKCTTGYSDKYTEIRRKLRSSSFYTESNCLWTCLMERIMYFDKCFPYELEEWKSLETSDYENLTACSRTSVKENL